MKKIIVGIDFSTEADLATRQATDIARHAGGELVLLHCGDTLELPGGHDATDASSSYLRTPVAETALCNAAKTMAADLVVVGTHRRSGVRGFLLGSLAAHVTKSCSTDVLVARGEGAGRGGFRRVLVATDFSPAAERALDRALELAARDAEVDVVHYGGLPWPNLDEGGPTGVEPADPTIREIAETVRAHGEDLIASRRQPRMKIAFHVLPGVPMPSLLQRLDEHPYDLIALGTHPRRGLRLFARDSTIESVVMHAPCSVLVATHSRLAQAARKPAPLLTAVMGG